MMPGWCVPVFLGHFVLTGEVMASATLSNPARQPWLGVQYDALCRKEWSERSNLNEPGFDVNQASVLEIMHRASRALQ